MKTAEEYTTEFGYLFGNRTGMSLKLEAKISQWLQSFMIEHDKEITDIIDEMIEKYKPDPKDILCADSENSYSEAEEALTELKERIKEK